MFCVRWGHRTPGPTVEWPLDGIVWVLIGVLVLAFVHGWGAVLVGVGLIGYGISRLVSLPPRSSATARTAEHPRVL